MELTAGVHWYRAVVLDRPTDEVVADLAGVLGESVEVRDTGQHGYDTTFVVGVVRAMANESRPEMGTMVEVTGEACERLGFDGVARVHTALRGRLARLDLAVDGVPFSPQDVRDAWRQGDVRTRVKVERDARPDRRWRTSRWHESAQGDTFTMGSRQSTQHVRVYDRRGPTRIELEMKDGTAQAAAQLVFAAGGSSLAEAAVGLLRRFADFVDASSSANASRRALLPWWAAFVAAVDRARLALPALTVRSVAETRAWVEHQVGPALALVAQAYGWDGLAQLVRDGRLRWRARHRQALTDAGLGWRTMGASV